MSAARALSAAALLAVVTACAPSGGPDAGADDDGGLPGDGDVDAGAPEDDAGAPSDAGPPDGGLQADAGPGPDGGSACLVDPCADVPPSGRALSLTTGASPALVVGGTSLAVGTATRADVEAALGGAGAPDALNPYRSRYCADRLSVTYVDDVSGGAFDGAPSAADRLSRVVVLAGAAASTSDGVTFDLDLGGAIAQAGTPSSTHAPAGTSVAFYADRGFGLVSEDGAALSALLLFRPQPQDRFGLALDLANGRLGSAETAPLTAGSSSFADAAALLGTAYDADGTVTVSGIPVKVRLYAALGVRLAGACGFDFDCEETDDVASISISPPFAGSDQQIGIGTPRSEVEERFGAGQPDHNQPEVSRYPTAKPLGVVYVEDAHCVPRAAAYVLNFQSF